MTHLKTLVLGGFGVDAGILRASCGEDASYCDGTALAASCIVEGKLRSDWIAMAAARIGPVESLVGWSTGAILALAVAPLLLPTRLTLLAPTPSFCRRDGWTFGTRPRILAAMRDAIRADRDAAIAAFCQTAGVSPQWATVADEETLCAALSFLEQADLRTRIHAPAVHCRVFLGTEDVVVPPDASRFSAQSLGAELHEHRGGHGFFCGDSSFSL